MELKSIFDKDEKKRLDHIHMKQSERQTLSPEVLFGAFKRCLGLQKLFIHRLDNWDDKKIIKLLNHKDEFGCLTLKNLQFLHLCSCHQATSKIFDSIFQLKKLEYLNVVSSRGVPVSSLENSILSLKELKRLDFCKCSMIDDAIIRQVASLTSLTLLDISFCVSIKEKSSIMLLTQLCSLQKISLAHLSNSATLDDQDLHQYCLCLTRLIEMNISGHDKITTISPCLSISSLRALTINGCINISDQSISLSLSQFQNHQLSQLVAYNVPFIECSFEKFTHLSSLYTDNFSNAMAQSLIKCENLKKLSIVQIYDQEAMVDDEDLRFVALYKLKSLKTLQIFSNWSPNVKVLKRLREELLHSFIFIQSKSEVKRNLKFLSLKQTEFAVEKEFILF